MKKWLCLLFFIIVACAPLSLQQKEKMWGTHAPVIKRAFASSVVKPGRLWRVYLDVEDIDGDLDAVYVFIEQPGVGLYPPSYIKLPKKYGHALKGYFSLPIADKWTWGIKMNIEIFCKDKAGHKSKTIYFSLKVVYKKPKPLAVPAQLNHFLGTINIDVRAPLFDKGGYLGGFDWIWGN
jgi:hypothetical protein